MICNGPVSIRPARSGDCEAIIGLWHTGWHDAHASIVPAGVLAYRTISSFRAWLKASDERFHVAERAGLIIGVATVRGSEVVKLYVGRAARGTGVADALLSHAEGYLACSGIRDAVLFCTAGNTRAQRFYERRGWCLAATSPDALWLPEGVSLEFIVATHRYEKQLRSGS